MLDENFQNSFEPKCFYLYLPLLMLLIPYVLNMFFPSAADFYFEKESGVIENVTVALLFCAIVYTVILAISAFKSATTSMSGMVFFRCWVVFYILGCIYYLGEEISWGQHLFDWKTPDAWLEVNDQQETNLHNTLGLFDQVPRAIVTLGVVIGGFIMPLIAKLRGSNFLPNTIYGFVLPGFSVVPTAATVLFVSVHDKIYDVLHLAMPMALQINDGELKEALIALFMFVYIASLYKKYKALHA